MPTPRGIVSGTRRTGYAIISEALATAPTRLAKNGGAGWGIPPGRGKPLGKET